METTPKREEGESIPKRKGQAGGEKNGRDLRVIPREK